MMNSKAPVWLWAVLLCCCYFFNPVLAQQTAPDNPNDAVTGEQYISPNLVEDPLSWSGPQSQGDCTYRPDGHGTWANDQAHWEGDWYTNPAYRACPQISSNGVMRFSWRPEEDMALTNNIDDVNPIIAPYAEALNDAGITVNGYNYSWIIKNADANDLNNTYSKGPYDKEGYGYSQDLLSITVEFIGQENQDIVWSKEYDYNYRIDDWTRFSGNEAFDLAGTDFEKIRITVDGYDAGYWAGYFGPEVQDVQFQLIFTVEETDKCDEDPLSSPTCYGYQDAFNKSVGLPTQAEMLAELESDYGGSNVDENGQQKVEDFFDGGTPDGTTFEYGEEIEAGIEAEIEVFEQEQLDQQTGITEEQKAQQTGASVVDSQSTGIIQEESTGVRKEESGGVQDPVEDVSAESLVEESIEIEESEKTSTTSNVNALSVAQEAEATGTAVADSAVSLATESATNSLNSDVATSTALNQQSQQESIQALNATTETAINNSSNQNSGSSGSSFSGEDGSDIDFSLDTSGNIMSSGNITSNDPSALIESTNVLNGSITSLNDYTPNSNNGGTNNNNSLESGNLASNDGIDLSTGLSPNTGATDFNQSLSDSQFGVESGNETDQSVFVAEFELASLDQNILDDVINNVINTMLLMQNDAKDNFKEDNNGESQLTAEEEDALVASAQSGDDSEDAQAALLGYNPEFRAYQTPQVPDNQFYQPKEIYSTQENYDNPNQRFFNGASDATHRKMVRQQYEGSNK